MPADTALHKAAYKGNVNEYLETFETSGIDINVQGAQGRTPLHRAISVKCFEIVEIMVKNHEANVNSVDNAGFTPLHWASLVNAHKCAELLLRNNSDPNIQSKKGETALHLAATKGNKEMIILLQKTENVNLDLTNNDGLTAYELAKEAYKNSKRTGAQHKRNMKLLKPSKSSYCLC